jgi:hypothetical protein
VTVTVMMDFQVGKASLRAWGRRPRGLCSSASRSNDQVRSLPAAAAGSESLRVGGPGSRPQAQIETLMPVDSESLSSGLTQLQVEVNLKFQVRVNLKLTRRLTVY